MHGLFIFLVCILCCAVIFSVGCEVWDARVEEELEAVGLGFYLGGLSGCGKVRVRKRRRRIGGLALSIS